MGTTERDLLRRLRDRLRAENEQAGIYGDRPQAPTQQPDFSPSQVQLLEDSVQRSFDGPPIMERLARAVRGTGGVGQNLQDMVVEGGRQITDVHIPRTLGGIRETLARAAESGSSYDQLLVDEGFADPSAVENPGLLDRIGKAAAEQIRYGSERDFAASDAAAEAAAERTSSPGAVTGRILGELGMTGLEYAGGGRLLRGPGVRGAPIIPEALKDALAVLPLDVASVTRPQDSSAAFLAEVAPESIETPLGDIPAQDILRRISESETGRALFEAGFGFTGDVGLRAAGRGLARGAEALRDPLRVGDDVDAALRGYASEVDQTPPDAPPETIRGLLPPGPHRTPPPSPEPGTPEDFGAWFRNESLVRGAEREAAERAAPPIREENPLRDPPQPVQPQRALPSGMQRPALQRGPLITPPPRKRPETPEEYAAWLRGETLRNTRGDEGHVAQEILRFMGRTGGGAAAGAAIAEDPAEGAALGAVGANVPAAIRGMRRMGDAGALFNPIFRGDAGGDLRPRDFPGVYFSKSAEVAGEYGPVRAWRTGDINSLDITSSEGRALVRQFADQHGWSFADQDEVVSSLGFFPNEEWVDFLKSRGYEAVEHGDDVLVFGDDALAGVSPVRSGSVSGAPAVTQEAVSTGRHGFMRAMGDQPLEVRDAFTQDIRAALTDESGVDVTVPIVRQIVPGTENLQVEVQTGRGVWGGSVNPNEVVVLRGLEAMDEESQRAAVQAYMAVNGIVRGQDAQAALRVRPDYEGTPGFVLGRYQGGGDPGALDADQLAEVLEALKARGVSATVADGDGLVLAVDFDGAGADALRAQIEELGVDGLHAEFHGFDGEYLDGTRTYLERIGRNPAAVAGLADLLEARVGPVYDRYAQQLGLGPDATAGLRSRIEELRTVANQLENPPPRGQSSGITVPEAAPIVAQRFRVLRSSKPATRVKRIAERINVLIDEFLEETGVSQELASDWYRTGSTENRRVAQSVIPELRDEDNYTLYTVVSSILSNGQEVPDEVASSLGVMEQFFRTGRISMLDPAAEQLMTYRVARANGTEAPQRAMRGPKGLGMKTLSGSDELIPASPRSLTHQGAFRVLESMIEDLGVEQTVAMLRGTVSRRKGGELQDVPVLQELFGPKIGRYAADKLGVHGGTDAEATLDLWMARLYHAVNGQAAVNAAGEIDDTVTPLMRREMNAAMQRLARQRDVPVSTIQAESWYGIKHAYRKAGAKEKADAYATLPSAATDALFTPRYGLDPETGMGFPKPEQMVGEAQEGWDPIGAFQTLRSRPEYQQRMNGGDPRAGFDVGVSRALGGAALGGTAGAALSPEGEEGTFGLAGAALGAGVGMASLRTRIKPGRRPEIDAAAAKELERADVELPKAPGTQGATRSPYGGDVDVEEHINMAAYQLDPEAEAVLRREVERVVRQENLAPKTTESHQRVSEIAASIGLTPEELSRPGEFANRYEMVAMRNVIDRNVRLTSNVEKELATNTHVDGPKKGQMLDPQERAAREAAVQGLEAQTDALLNRFIRQRTEDGRNLAAHKILANQTKDPLTWVARAKRKLNGVTPGPDVQAAITKALDEDDIEGVARLVAELERSPVSEQLSALWKAGLLTAPTTHQVNMISTGGNLMLESLKDPAASLGDRILTGALRLAASAGARLKGHVRPEVGRTKSSGVGLKTLGRGSRRGVSDIRRTLQGRAASTEAARKWDWRETKIDFVPPWLGGRVANPVLDGYQRVVFRALSAEDKFFKAIRVEQSILDQARVVAINEGADNVGRRAAELYDGWREDGYRALPDDVAMQAIYDGEVATFTDKSTLSRMAGSVKGAARRAAKEGSAAGQAANFLAEGIAPFTGTPSNVVSRVVEYTPLGLAGAVYDASRLVGMAYAGKGIEKAAQRRAAEMFGRSVTGGGVLALGYMLYNEGLMTLGYPESQGERGNWEITGKQEFSVIQGDEWHSLERFSPVGNLLAVGGYVARSAQDPEAGTLDIASDASFGLANMVISQSFLEGTRRFLDDVQMTESGDDRAKGRFVMNQARSVVPNMIRRIAQAMDEGPDGLVQIRETETWQDAIKSALPIMREQLPLARDAFGETRTRKTPTAEFVDLTYSSLDKSQMDAVRREFARLDAPITARRRDRAGGETAEAYSYRARTEGKELWEGLHQLFSSDAYRVHVIDQAREMAVRPSEVRELADALRRELISETISRIRGAQTRARREQQR